MLPESDAPGGALARAMMPGAAPDRTSARYVALAGIIDYAGLFPPAELALAAALASYRAYQASADRWMLGRFVVPALLLPQLEGLLDPARREQALPLTVLLGADLAEGVAMVERFSARAPQHGALVESVEVKAGSEAQVRSVLARVPPKWRRYVEIPPGPSAEAALEAVAGGGAFAKLRTGGTTADAFPSPTELLGLLSRAASLRLAFKATAGLHHPLRGSYRLSYAADAPSGTMYGFLNLLLASALLWRQRPLAEARAALLESDPAPLRFGPRELHWREVRVSSEELAELRRSFFHSFGSCSFREPLDEVTAGGW